jgi:hypothetical protein
VQVELAVARVGARHVELPPLGEPSLDQRPGVELVAERQAGEDPARRGDLRQRGDPLGGASRVAAARGFWQRREPRRELAAQLALGRRQGISARGGKPTR